jgi:hypothetical protein
MPTITIEIEMTIFAEKSIFLLILSRMLQVGQVKISGRAACRRLRL